jgi:hypothetical protein
MPKWLKGGIVGWGAIAALTIVVSLATDVPDNFIQIVLYG